MEPANNNGNLQRTGETLTPKKKGKQIVKKITGNRKLMGAITLIALTVIVAGLNYYENQQNQIYVDQATITAPIISLAPANSATLDRVTVKEGDKVTKGKIVAYMAGDVPITAGASGLVIWVQNTPGQMFTSQTPIVKMIEPSELRVIGKVEEDKGLSDIKVGQKVMFTVDAFGSKQYYGVVDTITPTADTASVVFSISDKRSEQNFDVKVRYDTYAYPELLNGMSARMWIYKT